MSERIKDGGPAFPAKVSVNRDTDELMPHQFGNDSFCATGISMRDYFAAKAMQAVLVNSSAPADKHAEMLSIVAKVAYMAADAMLEAREAAK